MVFAENDLVPLNFFAFFHDVGMALDSGKEAYMIYLDFSKAFDSVSHPKLLFKL
jgi:hypothetical protein